MGLASAALHSRVVVLALSITLGRGDLAGQDRVIQGEPRVGTSKRGLYYSISGRGEPLVLIHGFQTDHREWDEVAAVLGTTRQIIRYDLRGHGRSASAVDAFYPHEDLAGLLEELGVRNADIVGLSAGSNVALELALERAELVRRLVMVSPGIPEIRVNAPREWMRPIGDAVRAGDAKRAAALWWESPMMAGTRARGAAGERYHEVVLDNARIWTQNAAAQQRPAPSPADRLRGLRHPLLIVVGGADVTGSQQQADSILARQPNATRVIVRDAGHMVSTERPAELAGEIDRFLRASRPEEKQSSSFADARGTDTANVLPAPTRAVPIGRITYHWIDSSRAESFAPDSGRRREVLVDVWYPATGAGGRERASYLPNLSLLRSVFDEQGMTRRFAPAYAVMQSGRLRTHTFAGPPAQCPRGGCPVLIFSHGGGVERAFYTAQYEELVANGFVVAAVAHSYLTHAVVFPDGRVVRLAPRDTGVSTPGLPRWRRQAAASWAASIRNTDVAAADIRFVVSQLTRYTEIPDLGAPFARQLDLDRLGALGHSMGGLAAARACQIDRRIKACLNQDGVAANLPLRRDERGRTLQQPFMYFGRVEPVPTPWPDSLLALHEMTRAEEDSILRLRPLQQDSILAMIPSGAWRLRLTAGIATHMSFSDEPLLAAADDSVRRASALRVLALVNRYTVAFFDLTLRGNHSTTLDRRVQPDSGLVSIQRFAPGASR